MAVVERLIREHRVAVIPGMAFRHDGRCVFPDRLRGLQKATVAEASGGWFGAARDSSAERHGREVPPRFDGRAWTALFLVTLAAYSTYFRNFAYPAVPFWDERYYLVDAQKYLHGSTSSTCTAARQAAHRARRAAVPVRTSSRRSFSM